MEIHHAMMVRCDPARVYAALTQPEDLGVWMDAPALGEAQVGAEMQFQYDQGKRALKVAVTRLDAPNRVEWRIVQPMWPPVPSEQVVTWALSPYETSTLVDFTMTGWPAEDDVKASVSYKWALFMARLKIYLGDSREVQSILPYIKG